MPDIGPLLGDWGYLAIFLVVVLGNVGLPVPEETTLILAGYLVWRGELRFPIVLGVGIISAVGGDNVGYWIGRRYGGGALDRFRTLIQVSPGRFERMRGFLIRYGPLAVFSARFLAGLRFLAGPLAGALGIRLRPFMIGNVLGAVVFVPLAVGAGYAVGVGLGAYVEHVRRLLGEVEHLLLIGAVMVIGVLLSLRVLRAFRAVPGS
jgi:membrane protein DedA with SNARE-associated domain